MKILRNHAQNGNCHHVTFFYAAELPISLKRMAATPFARCSGQKSRLGRVKVSFASAVDYDAFPGQEYICTEKAKETYLCEKLIF